MPEQATAQQGTAASQGADGTATTTLTAEQQAAAATAGTAGTDGDTDASKTAAAAKTPTWPENWRETAAGDDPKKLARLQRYTDPVKALDAMIEAQNKIRAGEFAKPLAADATPEQIAEYRTANGIPDKPEGYFEKLPNGLVIGEDDKALFDSFGKEMHALNASPAFMHKAAEWYYKLQDDKAAAQSAKDKEQATATSELLRDEWGADFKANVSHVNAFVEGMGKDLAAQFKDATLPDGTRLFNNPDVIKWIANQARELNPMGTIVPAGAESQAAGAADELAKLQKLSGNQHSEYWKGPKAEQLQARMRTLLEWQEKAAKRNAA